MITSGFNIEHAKALCKPKTFELYEKNILNKIEVIFTINL